MCNFFSCCKFYVPLIIFNHSAQYSVEMNIHLSVVFQVFRQKPYNLQTESLFIIKNFNRIAINLIHCWHSISPFLHQIKCLSNKGKQSAIEWRWISYLEQIFIKRVQPRPQSTHLAFPLTSLDIYHIPWNKMQIFIIGTYK